MPRLERESTGGFARCARGCFHGERSDIGGSGGCVKEGDIMRIALAASRTAVALIAACALSMPSSAQTWPDKPIKLIVNFPPGGVADTLARNIGPGLSEALKQPVVIENRPGANGSIGADVVAKSPPDGYTFLVTSGGAMTVDPFLYSNLPYDTQK